MPAIDQFLFCCAGVAVLFTTELFAVQTANVDEQRRSAIAWESIYA